MAGAGARRGARAAPLAGGECMGVPRSTRGERALAGKGEGARGRRRGRGARRSALDARAWQCWRAAGEGGYGEPGHGKLWPLRAPCLNKLNSRPTWGGWLGGALSARRPPEGGRAGRERPRPRRGSRSRAPAARRPHRLGPRAEREARDSGALSSPAGAAGRGAPGLDFDNGALASSVGAAGRGRPEAALPGCVSSAVGGRGPGPYGPAAPAARRPHRSGPCTILWMNRIHATWCSRISGPSRRKVNARIGGSTGAAAGVPAREACASPAPASPAS
jgi:hypothetical protein